VRDNEPKFTLLYLLVNFSECDFIVVTKYDFLDLEISVDEEQGAFRNVVIENRMEFLINMLRTVKN